MATKADLDNFVEKTNFNDKLKNLNKKVTSNKTNHLQTENKLTDLTNEVAKVSEKKIQLFVRKNIFYRWRWLSECFS